MTSRSSRPLRPVLAVGLAVLVVVASSGAAAVTVGPFPADPLRLSIADASAVDDTWVESRTLDLSGSDVVGVTTAINTTLDTSVSVDVIVQLERLDGTVVEKETTTVLLDTVGVTIVDLSLSQAHSHDEFAAVNVTVTPSV